MQFLVASIYRRLLKAIRKSSALEVYTDGSSKGGVGSWAYVISRNGKNVAEDSGRVRRANSNSMEFQAAIEAIKTIRENSNITLFSDSRILIDTMKFGTGPRAHQLQIDELLQICKNLKVEWHWVKAHNGNELNERCDHLCNLARSHERSSLPRI